MQKRDIIDVDKLESELVSALEADRKYSRENDAKFRAVHQKVATYEEFRDIVKASHLSPLDRDDIRGRKGRKQLWNPLASTAGPGVGFVVSDHHVNAPTHPTNTQGFIRKWRILKSSPQDQYQFLLQLGGDQLTSIFKVEVSMGLLGEMMVILNCCFVAEDRDVVMEILTVLSRSLRFSLSLTFLVQAERKAVRELFDKLRVEEQAEYLADKTLFDLWKLYEL